MPLGQQLYNSVLPPAFELLPKEQRLLHQMYPEIDWSKVEFNAGLPWFMHFTFAIGTALPHSYNGQRVHICLRDKDRRSLNERLCIMVHEAFHIQQYHDLESMTSGSWGWGYNRRFMRYYIGWYFQTLWEALFEDKMTWKDAKQHAYRQHPMERTAYFHEGIFRKNINVYRGHSVIGFFNQVPRLVCTNSHVPAAPHWFFHGLATFVCVLIALIKPLLDALIFPLALLLGGRRGTPFQ
jgi:hypothetical protein